MKAISKILLLLIACCGLLTACEKGNGLKPYIVESEGAEALPIYGAGAAFGWTATAIPADETDPNLYIFEKELTYNAENKLFKFQLSEGDWDKIYYLVPQVCDYRQEGADRDYAKLIEAGQTYPMFKCSEMTGNLLDNFWGVPEDGSGTYVLTVNLKQQTLKVEKK